MTREWMIAALAAGVLSGCGGGADEPPPPEPAPAAGVDTLPATPPGTVDTVGVGTDPPTAGGQLVDTAAVPGPTDTAAGTATAP